MLCGERARGGAIQRPEPIQRSAPKAVGEKRKDEDDETDDIADGSRGDCSLALVVGAALATPPKDATVTPLTRATLGNFEANNDGIEVESERHSADIAIAKVVLEPGGSTGWHHHPGVTLVSVASGTVTEYDNKCEKSVYKAGEGFVESHDAVRRCAQQWQQKGGALRNVHRADEYY